MRTRDADIRQALEDHLWTFHGSEPGTVLRHEVGVCAGQRRIDLALLNGEFAGYEIKSDEDRLTRLKGQAAAYGRVLDRATLVTTERHVDHALDQLPTWWSVAVAYFEGDAIAFEWVQTGATNEAHDAFAVAQMLWRDEALEELRERGLGRGLSKRARHYVWEELANSLELDELRTVVRERLKERPAWPGGQRRGQGDETCRTPATP